MNVGTLVQKMLENSLINSIWYFLTISGEIIDIAARVEHNSTAPEVTLATS